MKTRRQYFEELPEPYRTQAIENAISYGKTGRVITIDNEVQNIKRAILGGFIFIETTQGEDYWFDLINSL